VLDLLAGLVDKSLGSAEADAQGRVRHSVLETLRQDGHETLDVAGDAGAVGWDAARLEALATAGR
jgi:hypothetical protein